MNEKVLNRSPRLPGLPDSTNHEAPDSVVQRQFLALFYGCFENQEKRNNLLFLWIGLESGHAQCELFVCCSCRQFFERGFSGRSPSPAVFS